MARFHELIEMLRNPGEDGVPETVYDDLGAEYESVLSGSVERDALHEEAIIALNGEISALKAQNYDLLMAQARSADAEPEADDPEDEPEDEGIDSLFGNS